MPAYGAKGTSRQAGPLAPDTESGQHLENDEGARENLNAKVVSMIGAEESLKTKLKDHGKGCCAAICDHCPEEGNPSRLQSRRRWKTRGGCL